MVLCSCAPSDSACGEWHIMETKSSSNDGVCHDIHTKKCEEGTSNLESTDRNCFPVVFSQMNLTSLVHSFLRVSSNLSSFQTKKPPAGIITLTSCLMNGMYVGLYINFEVFTAVGIWLPVLCAVPSCIVCVYLTTL